MATTGGKFVAFSQYINDLSLEANGTYKIYPSKFILLNQNSEYADPSDAMDEVRLVDSTDYVGIRAVGLSELSTSASDGTTIADNSNVVGFGDISFLSHDTYNGFTYSEIYVHVPNTVGLAENKEIIIDDTFDSEILATDTIFEQDTSAEDSTSTTFTQVLLFYNLYMTSDGVDMELICQDMPLGVYYVYDEDSNLTSTEVLTSTDTLYGSGTSWSVRICSRFALSESESTIAASSSDYVTLSKVLSQVGECLESIQEINGSKYTNLTDIKSYLTSFKNDHTINVPYILENGWYVNGKYIGEAITGDDVTSVLEFLNTYADELSNLSDLSDISSSISSLEERVSDLESEVSGSDTSIVGDGLTTVSTSNDVATVSTYAIASVSSDSGSFTSGSSNGTNLSISGDNATSTSVSGSTLTVSTPYAFTSIKFGSNTSTASSSSSTLTIANDKDSILNISLNNNTLTFGASAISGINADSGSGISSGGVTIAGGDGIETSISGSTLTITNTSVLSSDNAGNNITIATNSSGTAIISADYAITSIGLSGSADDVFTASASGSGVLFEAGDGIELSYSESEGTGTITIGISSSYLESNEAISHYYATLSTSDNSDDVPEGGTLEIVGGGITETSLETDGTTQTVTITTNAFNSIGVNSSSNIISASDYSSIVLSAGSGVSLSKSGNEITISGSGTSGTSGVSAIVNSGGTSSVSGNVYMIGENATSVGIDSDNNRVTISTPYAFTDITAGGETISASLSNSSLTLVGSGIGISTSGSTITFTGSGTGLSTVYLNGSSTSLDVSNGSMTIYGEDAITVGRTTTTSLYIKSAYAFTGIIGDSGSAEASSSSVEFSILGGDFVTTSIENNIMTISLVGIPYTSFSGDSGGTQSASTDNTNIAFTASGAGSTTSSGSGLDIYIPYAFTSLNIISDNTATNIGAEDYQSFTLTAGSGINLGVSGSNITIAAEASAESSIQSIILNGESAYAASDNGTTLYINTGDYITSSLSGSTLILGVDYSSLASNLSSGSTVTWTGLLSSGTAIGTLGIDGTNYILYAPTSSTSSSTETYTSTTISSTDGTLYLLGAASGSTTSTTTLYKRSAAVGSSSVPIYISSSGAATACGSTSWSANYTSSTGVSIGTLTVLGNAYTLYAPASSGSSGVTIGSSSTVYFTGISSQTTGTVTSLYYSSTSVYSSSGSLYASAFYETSDVNLKENMKSISSEEIEKTKNVELMSFNFREGDTSKKYGVIAQQIEDIGLGELIKTNEDTGIKSVDYTSLLVLKIKMLEEENKKLNERISKLENVIEKIIQN